jgi:hypothetical protein
MASTITVLTPCQTYIDGLPDNLKEAMESYQVAHEGYLNEEDSLLVYRIAHGIQYSDCLSDKAVDGDFSCLNSLPEDLKEQIILLYKSFVDSGEPRFYSSLSDCLKWRPLYPLEEPFLTEDDSSALGAAVCAYVSSHTSEELIDTEVQFLIRISRWRNLERLTPKEVRSSICTLTSLSNIIIFRLVTDT